MSRSTAIFLAFETALACTAPVGGQISPALDLPAVLGSVGAPAWTADSLRTGRPVSFLVQGTPANQISIFAAIRVATTPGSFLQRFTDLEVYRRRAMVHGVGAVSSPPSRTDFDSLPVPPSDVSALTSCTEGSCSVKVPADVIRAVVASPTVPVDSLMKSLFRALSERFLIGGLDSLPAFADKPTPTTPAQGLDALLTDSTPVLSWFPELRDQLGATDHPSPSPELFWLGESFGLRDVLSLNATTTRSTGRPDVPAIVLTERLYSSHYFVAGYSVTALLADSAETGAPPAYYLIYSARYLLDSSLNFLERRQLSGRLHSYAEDLVTGEKAGLESG